MIIFHSNWIHDLFFTRIMRSRQFYLVSRCKDATASPHYSHNQFKVGEQLPHRFLEDERCSLCCSDLYPWELPSMSMSLWHNKKWHCSLCCPNVFQNRSIVLRTILFRVLSLLTQQNNGDSLTSWNRTFTWIECLTTLRHFSKNFSC